MKEINPAEIESRQLYKLISGSVVPRPIAWVSTVSTDGIRNLAPFSYFTGITGEPPTVLFCPGHRSSDDGQKDTYHNVKATGEFVINFVNEDTVEAMNITAVEAAPEVDEFERAGLTPIPSKMVSAPRVQESPIHFECKLLQIVDVGNAHVVIGQIVYMHFAEDVYKEGNYIDIPALKPVARLAGPQYAHIHDLFELQRPPSEIRHKGDKA